MEISVDHCSPSLKRVGQGRTRIVGIYTSFVRTPRLLVFHRRVHMGQDIYERHQEFSVRGVVERCLRTLSAEIPGTLEVAAELDSTARSVSSHRSRRYIAPARELLYPDAQHLAYCSTWIDGFWVATNIGVKEAIAILSLACDAARIERQHLSQLTLH